MTDAVRHVDVVVWSGPPLLLLDLWKGRHVVLIDAMRSGRPPGSVAVLDESAINSSAWSVSSHDAGIAETFVLARTMGLGPMSLTVVAVEIGRHHYGQRMTRDVEHAVPIALARVLDCLNGLNTPTGAIRDTTPP